MWALVVLIAILWLVASYHFWSYRQNADRERREWQRELADRKEEVDDLRNRLMYALGKPWEGPTEIPERTPLVAVPPVFTDPGPEMAETWPS